MPSASQFTQYVRYKAQAAGCPVKNTSKRNFFTFMYAPPPSMAYCGILNNFFPPIINPPSGGCGNFYTGIVLDGGDPNSNSPCILFGGNPPDTTGQVLLG